MTGRSQTVNQPAVDEPQKVGAEVEDKTTQAENTGAQPASVQVATQVVASLIANGVTEVVVCPGSRSAPLAYALAAAEKAGRINTHICTDERGGAFYALGLSRAARDLGQNQANGSTESEQQAPVALVMTSGTAVANLHPAVLEATHSQVPLLILSADRPAYLRETGANQTTQQPGLFGAAPVWEFDVDAGYPPAQIPALVARAIAGANGTLSNQPGVAHLNLCFDTPLVPNGEITIPELASAGLPASPQPFTLPRPMLVNRGRGRLTVPTNAVVIAGDGAGPEAAYLAAKLGLPLMAEPSSGARGHGLEAEYRTLWDADPCLSDYQSAIGLGGKLTELAKKVETVVVLGHPTLSRPITALMAHAQKRIVVTNWATWNGSLQPGDEVLTLTEVLASVAGSMGVAGGETTHDVVKASGGASGGDAAASDTSYNDSSESMHNDSLLVARPEKREWLVAWQQASLAALPRQLCGVSEPLTQDRTELTRELVAALLWQQASWDGLPLIVGASSAIRVMDRVAGALGQQKLGTQEIIPAGPAPIVFANRGLAGIDGTLATAAGIGRHVGAGVRVLVGDLTFLHDAMSLLPTFALGQDGQRVPMQVVVWNDEGGAIFAGLEHQQAPAELFDRYFRTKQRFNYQHFAAAVGAKYEKVTNPAELTRLTNWDGQTTEIMEIVLPWPGE
ncbi:hypothetical protein BK816_07515 [Boudabousia tangfeifanii]|uniref:2-succinyl-5-enolpyruvyl-6-hydroxy-3-cyclohexene-1-carboxylate synthase n=1 Tax=Boudabousia tangfeifanii TaxID=1912795 RepID=A0A1D9MLU7_9ACTO|nr:thiamine pyrophosphate-binding protein [Boudabousia tangfeifanii]AOZ73159.1 hypothetical protein BK816_07515 [Boudabousia tangfeifanii]